MDEQQTTHEDLAEEFRSLGKNLVEALRAAWDSSERQKLQKELEAGLAETASFLKEEAVKFSQSQSGQQLKSDLEELHQRVKRGEAETAARKEILEALRTVNAELEKAAKKWKGGPEGPHQTGS
jgi:DNA-binding transcriptional regulator YbjK